VQRASELSEREVNCTGKLLNFAGGIGSLIDSYLLTIFPDLMCDFPTETFKKMGVELMPSKNSGLASQFLAPW